MKKKIICGLITGVIAGAAPGGLTGGFTVWNGGMAVQAQPTVSVPALLTPANDAAFGAAGDNNNAGAKDYLQTGFHLMKTETLGPLKIGVSASDLLNLLGEASEKSPPRIWGADGLEHQTWRYSAEEIELDLVKDRNGVQKVDRILIKKPCSYKTSRNIGIGNAETDIRTAYREEINPQDSRANRLVAGTIYGGVIFQLQDGLISSVFIGAAAE